MRKAKATVTIGIPAYNEEANIGNLRDTTPNMGRSITIKIFGFKISFTNIREFLIIFRAVFLHKEYNFHSQKDEPFVIDCGSHIGLSVLFIKKKYPKARIIGFEPNPVTFKILERNVKQNNLGGVELINAAVADKDGTVNFITNTKANKLWRRQGSNWPWSDFVEGSKRYDSGIHKKIKVPSLRLSSFIDREVDFLKLDIEGSEGKVIGEVKDKLHLIREITMEFHGNSANKSNKLEDILTTLRENSFAYQIEQNGKVVDGQNVNKTNPYWTTIRAKKSESRLNTNTIRKKLTVSIGIPAHNEEANIYRLLKCLIHQFEKGIAIKKIIIVNDGSLDNTTQEIRKVHDKRILLVNNASRKGQIFCQNLIFSRANSDVVVLMEADTEPTNLNYIKTLVEPTINDRTIGIVQGNYVFAQPKTFIGRVLHLQTSIFHRAITKEQNFRGNFNSGRGGRAFSRRVYTKLHWPVHVPEDNFAALWCKQRKIPIVVQKRAVCVFRIPENITDFRRARQKMVTGRIALEKYFNVNDVRVLYGSGDESIVKMFIEFMLTNPLYCVVYFFLKIYAEIISFNKHFSDYWEIGRSTKYVLTDSSYASRL